MGVNVDLLFHIPSWGSFGACWRSVGGFLGVCRWPPETLWSFLEPLGCSLEWNIQLKTISYAFLIILEGMLGAGWGMLGAGFTSKIVSFRVPRGIERQPIFHRFGNRFLNDF